MFTFVRRALPALVVAFTLTACFDLEEGGGGGQNPGHTEHGTSWTVLVYMVADNDLEPFALADLAEMSQVGQTGDFRFVVQADRAEGYTADGIGNLPNWTSTKRLVVEQGAFVELEDLGEVNMGDPNTLADFIQWGMRTYPADRTALIFWDHGSAWRGFGADESLDLDALSVTEMQAGIAAGLQQAGGGTFALVGYDACLMSSWEMALALRPYAEYLLASEELEPGHGWDWASFGVAANDATVNPVVLSRSIIDGFHAQAVANDTAANITLSLTDLYALDELQQGIELLATEGQRNLDEGAITLARAVDTSLSFNRTPDPSQSSHMVDLGSLAATLAASDTRFAAAKQQIDVGLERAVLYRSSGPITAAATGLSVYFPPKLANYRADYDDLKEMASWRTFLKAYFGDGTQGVTPTFINPGRVAEVFINGGTLNVAGNLAAGANAAIATADLHYGFRLNTGEVALLGDQPASFDATTVTGQWDLSVLTLQQGATTGYAYLSLQASGSSNVAAVIPFAYSAPGAASEAYCIRQLVFDSNNTLVQDTYYLITDAGVGELTPQSGSTVKPLLQIMDAQGNVNWAYGGDPMNPAAEISMSFSTVNPGTQVYGELRIANAGGQGDLVSALATVQ